MDNDTFLSVPNMKLCMNVFHQYMIDKYQFDINTDGKKTNVKKLLFDIMTDTYNKNKNNNIPLKDLNNITLNVARDYFTKNNNVNKKNTKPVSVKTLERDQNLYGPRILNFEQIKPQISIKKPINDEFENIENSRKREQERVLPQIDEMKPVMETAYEPDEFMRKVSELSRKRDDVEIKDLTTINETRLQQDSNIAQNIQNDPKALYQITQNNNDFAEKQRIEMQIMPSSREELLPPQINQMILLDKFLSINGFDRNWLIEKGRFEFKVDFNWGEHSIQQKYKNIKSIKATRVIIPMEIEQVRSVCNVPKPYFNHEFSFAYPYLMLNIDEFTDIYDGTNDSVRRCFCHLIFDKCYKAPNGRGYIILNTIQNEKKVFHPTPLSSLSKMTVSVRKPNGELLNTSRDEYQVFKVEYELYNKQFLKIVTNKYFDKNEFYKGDTVIIKNFALTNNAPGMSDDIISKFNDFINRKEGHEILEIGQANDSGYFRNYHINGPGYFDTTSGVFVLDNPMINNLQLFNDTIDFNTWEGTNGSILNASLQCTMTFKLQTVATDPSIVDTSYITNTVFA